MEKVKSSINKELTNKLIKIAKKFDLDLLILFGSRARGDFTKNSDWDFAYLKNKDLNYDDEINLFNDLVSILNNDKIDLINLKINKDNLKLLYDIFMFGVCIYEKKRGLFFDLRGDIFIDYLDFKSIFPLNEKIKILKKDLNI